MQRVIVVGGGLVGMAAAAFLAWHGVPTVLVERHPGAVANPRARGMNPRTVELFGQLGLARAVLDRRAHPDQLSGLVTLVADTLAGPERARPPWGAPADLDGVSPAPWCQIDQDRTEELLRRRAVALGAEVRYGTELTGFRQDDDGVTACLRDLASGRERELPAAYLVAADGYDSPVRGRLGIGVHGPGTFAHLLYLTFDADLGPALAGRDVGMAFLQQPEPGTFLMTHDRGRRWVFATPYHPERGERPADFGPDRLAGLVRTAVGLPDLELDLVPRFAGGDSVLSAFVIGAQVADRYAAGRVLLAGDAAHIMPPTGALGANTGVQDAHNLAWKLAAVLRGRAGPALLDSYQAERQPVAELTVRQAMAQQKQQTGLGGGSPDPAEAAAYPAVVLGPVYPAGAVLGAAAEATAVPPSQLSGQPGSRAPHLPVRRAGRDLSTLDLYGRDWVLLAGPTGTGWVAAARSATRRLGVPVRPYQVGVDLTDPTRCFAERHGVGPSGCLLVRPDGVVGWRNPGPPTDPDADLTAVLAGLLAVAELVGTPVG